MVEVEAVVAAECKMASSICNMVGYGGGINLFSGLFILALVGIIIFLLVREKQNDKI